MLGASDLRIIVRHVLPNTVAPILVIGSSQFATMVLLESGLSFLGMGVQAPLPSWGSMLAEGRDYLSNAWWLATAPGLMIALVVLGANLLGDGLRDLLDPTLRIWPTWSASLATARCASRAPTPSSGVRSSSRTTRRPPASASVHSATSWPSSRRCASIRSCAA